MSLDLNNLAVLLVSSHGVFAILGFGAYGVLNDVFTPIAQLKIAMFLLAAVIVFTTALFEYRHHATLPPHSRLNFSTRTRNAPCKIEESATDPRTTFFFTYKEVLTVLFFIFLCALLPGMEMIFYSVDSYLRIKSPSSTISSQTRQYQLNFLRALLIQECAPVLIAYPEPVFYFFLSSFTWVMSINEHNMLTPFVEFQGAMGLLAAVIVSTTALFEYRHHATLSSNSRLNFSTRTRVLIFVIRFFAGCSAAIALQLVSDELEREKKYWIQVSE
ncbi:unnamed protein product [Caenorhabditis auriculariae]|uniref:Uncharacterized protein n=1 Tax=Caenorhabditis auriculariae TaxID=2777116 RepID=A0A8S1HP92_9PELO|nr:unnamed protein product [Caenorhabditis auriculariae]